MRKLSALVGFVATLALCGSASALIYTIDDPPGVPGFSAGTATGTIEAIPASTVLLDTDTVCLAGNCTIASLEAMVFSVSVTGGAVNDIGVSALFINAVGLGYYKLGGPPDPSISGSLAVPSSPNFLFAGGLTGTSLPLFVTYAAGSFPQANVPFGTGAVQFMVAEFGAAGLHSVIGNATTVIPEPATGLLMGLGLLLVGAGSRLRRP